MSFSYDSAGNRVRREIVIEKKAAPTKDSADGQYFSDLLSDKEIRIYPNPTDGHLKVEIRGYDNSDSCELSVFSMSGQQILAANPDSSFTDVDMTSQANGVYIFLIILNGKESSWKIIKR